MNFRTKSTALLGLALMTVFPLSASHAQTGSAGAVAEKRVSLDAKNLPIRKAIEQLFQQAKSDFSIGNSLEGNVTVKIVDQPLESALRLLSRLSRVPFVVVKEAGVYIIKPRDSDGAVIDDRGLQQQAKSQNGTAEKPSDPAPAPAPKVDVAAPAEQKFTLDLKNVPLRDALEKLFRQAKLDFSLDNSVQGFVTLKVTDQPFEVVLRFLIRQAEVPLTFSKENGVYFIKLRQTASAIADEAPFQRGGSGAAGDRTLVADQDGNRLIALTGDTFAGSRQMDVIYLTYLDPADIAQLFRIIQIPSFSRQGGAGGTGAGSANAGGNGPSLGDGVPGAGSGLPGLGSGSGNPGLKH